MKTFFFLVQESPGRDINVVGNGKDPFRAQKEDHFAFIAESDLGRQAAIHAWQAGKDCCCCHDFGDDCPMPLLVAQAIPGKCFGRGLYSFAMHHPKSKGEVEHLLGAGNVGGTNAQLDVGSGNGGDIDGSHQ